MKDLRQLGSSFLAPWVGFDLVEHSRQSASGREIDTCLGRCGRRKMQSTPAELLCTLTYQLHIQVFRLRKSRRFDKKLGNQSWPNNRNDTELSLGISRERRNPLLGCDGHFEHQTKNRDPGCSKHVEVLDDKQPYLSIHVARNKGSRQLELCWSQPLSHSTPAG